MVKYLLILILNLPFVTLGVARAIGLYRKDRMSSARLISWLVIWGLVALGLIFAEPGYLWLQRHHLTDSTPLSIFDIFTITGVIASLSLILRLYSKIDDLDQNISTLNREVSIKLSKLK